MLWCGVRRQMRELESTTTMTVILTETVPRSSLRRADRLRAAIGKRTRASQVLACRIAELQRDVDAFKTRPHPLSTADLMARADVLCRCYEVEAEKRLEDKTIVLEEAALAACDPAESGAASAAASAE